MFIFKEAPEEEFKRLSSENGTSFSCVIDEQMSVEKEQKNFSLSNKSSSDSGLLKRSTEELVESSVSNASFSDSEKASANDISSRLTSPNASKTKTDSSLWHRV